MKFSLTQGGILVAVVGSLLMNFGFSEGCATEFTNQIPLVIGGLTAWYGRFRKGDVNIAGFKK